MRRAIALIELIFAMVIIAITLISVPNLISKTAKASNSAIDQEAISNAASYLDMIMSNYWDEADSDPKIGNPILTVENEDSALKEISKNVLGVNVKLGKRVGAPLNSSRLFGIDSSGNRIKATKDSKLGLEPTDKEPNDIDDYNNRSVQLTKTVENTTAIDGDYKDNKIQLSTKVNYIADASNPVNYNSNSINFDNPFANKINQSTNIKAITLTLTSPNDKNKKIVLRAFSCNIGSSTLREKKF